MNFKLTLIFIVLFIIFIIWSQTDDHDWPDGDA